MTNSEIIKEALDKLEAVEFLLLALYENTGNEAFETLRNKVETNYVELRHIEKEDK